MCDVARQERIIPWDGYCEATIPVVKGHHVTKQWE